MHRAEKEYLTIKENGQNCQTAHFAYSVSFAISSFLKFPVYLSGNATLTVIAQDNGIEYEYNPQSGTPPDRPPRSKHQGREAERLMINPPTFLKMNRYELDSAGIYL